MRFSVIVPVYNVEDYLEQCLGSILLQDFEDYECLMVDDGSTDSSGAICDRYASIDKRFKTIHKDNGGSSSARNVGISCARGDYVAFVDSDDFWQISELLKSLDKVIEDKKPDVLQIGLQFYDNETEKLGETRGGRLAFSMPDIGYADLLTQLVVEDELQISAYLLISSREFLEENRLYFVEGIKSEDIEWAMRLYACSPQIVTLPVVGYAYRQNRKGSITSTIDGSHMLDYASILSSSIDRVLSCNDEVRKPLMSYLMYQTVIASAHAQRTKLERNTQIAVDECLADICSKYLVGNTLNKKACLASILYKLGGYKLMSMALGFYLQNRKR